VSKSNFNCDSKAKTFLNKFRSDHLDKHNSEINSLSGITTPENLKEDDLANTWRQNKFIVKMSSYSYELLISFLHESKLTLILSIINQYIKLNSKSSFFFLLTKTNLI
jgi:transcription initiation factor TFIID subunit 5